MASNIHQTGALRRLLNLVLEASEAAVAIHYAAPWALDAPRQPGVEKSRDAKCHAYDEADCLAA